MCRINPPGFVMGSCNAERCLRAEFGKVPQVTEERGREGKRPRSRVLENARMRTGRSVDAGVLASSVGALT